MKTFLECVVFFGIIVLMTVLIGGLYASATGHPIW